VCHVCVCHVCVYPVACPRDVRPKEDLWLVSCFMSILDGDITSPELRLAFGWNVPVIHVCVCVCVCVCVL